MKKIMNAFLLCFVLLTGCTSTHDPYGSYVELDTSHNQKIANDAVQELVKILPPAKTHLVLSQTVNEDFGRKFVNSLRKKGYGLQQQPSINRNASGVELFYILDMPINKSLYRVTVSFGTQKISRVYKVKNDVLIAASFWIRKE